MPYSKILFKIIYICLLVCLVVGCIKYKNVKNIQRKTETIPQLLKQLESSDYETKKDAIRSLNEIGEIEPFNDEISKKLVNLLHDPDWRIRARAVIILRLVRNKQDIIELLLLTLKDKSAPVKIGAIKTLGLIGSKKAIEPLSFLLNDENKDVREMAAKVIQELR